MGAPYVKAVCMGRALMIPGMVGKNIGEWIKAGDLPKTVAKYGTTVEEIFVSYEELKAKYGSGSARSRSARSASTPTPRGSAPGLQQLMAGSRNFSL